MSLTLHTDLLTSSSGFHTPFYGEDSQTLDLLTLRDAFRRVSSRRDWRRTPRSAADFYEVSSKSNSDAESDYDVWLDRFYEGLYQELTRKFFEDVEIQATEEVEKREDVLTSLFESIKKDIWSFHTKYWGPKDVRRHWPMRVNRNLYMFMPSIHPHLNLRSRYGRFISLLNSAAALPEVGHQKQACGLFRKIIFGLELLNPQLQEFMICDLLCNFKWFDFMSKRSTMRTLCKVLRKQSRLERVYFENLDMERKEGIILLCALSRNSGDFIKELHMWRMFRYGQTPGLLNHLSSKGEFQCPSEELKFFSKIHFLQIMNKFTMLTHLSVNYAYLANRRGDVLLHLRCIRAGYLRKLRILCSMEERPLLTNPGYGVGGWKIPDGVWQRVAELCPDLRVCFVFLHMPQYENIILFLSKYTPVSYVYISSGMDFNFAVPWDVDSTLLEVRNWYAPTLETLCLHLWHHRDLLDYVIKSKILEEFPNLLDFEFIGVLEDVETLEVFCCRLSEGKYKLKSLLFWVEEQHTDHAKLILTRRRVNEIGQKFRKKFLMLDIDADLQTYAL